ncbi:MAG: response regulator [Myxococcales bacterium FL481]|nr:MAG: response regulator [Myxococcales bacterium FL481]
MNTLNVLVVDDNRVARAMVVRALRTSGLPFGDVKEAENGREALDMLKRTAFDLALVDIHMPSMSGDQLIATLRQQPETSKLPVIAVSSDVSPALNSFLREHDVPRVAKPFEPEELRTLIVARTGIAEDANEPGTIVDDSELDF